MTEQILIGIDPDVNKSGVCILRNCNITKRLTMQLYDVDFTILIKMLTTINSEYEQELIVFIECGFLNKSNWHLRPGDKAKYGSKIGTKIGANHQVSKLLIEHCRYNEIQYREIRPGKSKLTHKEFSTVTGFEYARTNQEQRDAAMLLCRSAEYILMKQKYKEKETNKEFGQLTIWGVK